MKFKSTKKPSHITDKQFALILIAPSLIVLLCIIVVPLIQGILFSFQENSLLRPDKAKFIGLRNYKMLLKDDIFWASAKASIRFVLGSVILGFCTGFMVALLLNQKIIIRRILRGLFLLPWVTPWVVTAFMTLYMFHGQVGIVNHVLKQLGLINEFQTWLGNEHLAIWVVTVGNAWYQFPFHMMTILAGLQTIPDDLLDAARVDGAGALSRFRHIILPYLRNIIVMSTSLMAIFSFKAFALIWTSTHGGPSFTTSIFSVLTYQLAFEEFNMGYAATVGSVSLVFLAVFAFIYIRTVEREIGI